MDTKSYKYSTHFLLLITCSLFVSCDPYSSFKKSVQNNASMSVMLVRYNKAISENGSYIPQDSFLIQAGSNIILSKGGGIGGAPQCGSFDDSLFFKIDYNPALKVNLDLNNASNWTRIQKGNNAKGYHVECRATITDADIVPK